MSPTIQLIHLTMRIERENQAQHRPSPANVDIFAAEETVSPAKQDKYNDHIFKPRHQRPQCDCI